MRRKEMVSVFSLYKLYIDQNCAHSIFAHMERYFKMKSKRWIVFSQNRRPGLVVFQHMETTSANVAGGWIVSDAQMHP